MNSVVEIVSCVQLFDLKFSINSWIEYYSSSELKLKLKSCDVVPVVCGGELSYLATLVFSV